MKPHSHWQRQRLELIGDDAKEQHIPETLASIIRRFKGFLL